jgi:hypothetical protein
MDTPEISEWLKNATTSKDKYTHRILTEDRAMRDHIMCELKQVVQKAHEDTRQHLRTLAGISLDPFDEETGEVPDGRLLARDPTIGYPEKLELQTLKGYFGEIFAGLISESFSHFDMEGWRVPAYPFRFHQTAFDQLERWRQTGREPGKTVGRTGNDMLAFFLDANGKITHSLVCEAKCSNGHSANLISDAHKQASSTESRPVDILRLIEILQNYDDPESKKWKKALQILYNRDIQTDYERCDLVSYICGKPPTDSNTWLSPHKPHSKYTAGRRLEAVEIHLSKVDELVKEVYDAGK